MTDVRPRTVTVNADDLAAVLDLAQDTHIADLPYTQRLRAALRQPCPAYVNVDPYVLERCTLDAGHEGPHLLRDDMWVTP